MEGASITQTHATQLKYVEGEWMNARAAIWTSFGLPRATAHRVWFCILLAPSMGTQARKRGMSLLAMPVNWTGELDQGHG